MNMSRAQWQLVAVAGIAVALVLCAALLFPSLVRRSNCGGNSAALAACKTVAVCFQLMVSAQGDNPVSIAELSAADQEYFKQVPGMNWPGAPTVLVTQARLKCGAQGGGEIIAVCDRAFDNVPRRMFGKAPLTHAVAYADGSIGLLSIEEFRRLDLSSFVDVRAIQDVKIE